MKYKQGDSVIVEATISTTQGVYRMSTDTYYEHEILGLASDYINREWLRNKIAFLSDENGHVDLGKNNYESGYGHALSDLLRTLPPKEEPVLPSHNEAMQSLDDVDDGKFRPVRISDNTKPLCILGNGYCMIPNGAVCVAKPEECLFFEPFPDKSSKEYWRAWAQEAIDHTEKEVCATCKLPDIILENTDARICDICPRKWKFQDSVPKFEFGDKVKRRGSSEIFVYLRSYNPTKAVIVNSIGNREAVQISELEKVEG